MLRNSIALGLLGAALVTQPTLSAERWKPEAGFVHKFGAAAQQDCRLAADERATSRGALYDCTHALSTQLLSISDRASTYVNRGVIHAARGDLDLAMADYERAIELEPTLAEAHLNIGTIHHRQENYAAAITAFTSAIDSGLEEPASGYFNRGLANAFDERVADAEADLNTALSLAPEWDRPAMWLEALAEAKETVQASQTGH